MTDNTKFIENIHNNESQLHKGFTFEEKQIIISMTIVPNDEVIVLLQYENTVVPLHSTNIVHPKLDSADVVEPENPQPQVPRRSTRERR